MASATLTELRWKRWRIALAILACVTTLSCQDSGSKQAIQRPGEGHTAPADVPPIQQAEARLSPQEIARRTFPSVVLLMMEDSNQQPVSLGSGFAVADGVVATNYHVISGASGGYAKPVGTDEKHRIVGTVGLSSEFDLALLRIEGFSARVLTVSEKVPDVGERVFAVGNPRGLEGTFSEGIVSGVRSVGSDAVLQVTAPISPGSSGGPILNETGEAIGVATATFADGQNLNFAVPGRYLQRLLKSPSAPAALRPQKQSPRSMFEQGGGKVGSTGLSAENFMWDTSYDNPYMREQGYSFSLRNRTGSTITSAWGVVIFNDRQGTPVDYRPYFFDGLLPPGLATRVQGSADYSVKKISTSYSGISEFSDRPRNLEMRVVSFEMSE